jgi:hypothetical protein
MPHYRVNIHGRNFQLSFDGKSEKMGFHTLRYAEAPNASQAELEALRHFRESPKYQELIGAALNETNDPPVLYAEETEEAEDGGPGRLPGLSFYRE